jgi:hypothetical protein
MQSAILDKLVLQNSENQTKMEFNFLLANHKRALVHIVPAWLLVTGQNLDRLQTLQCQHGNMLQCTSQSENPSSQLPRR